MRTPRRWYDALSGPLLWTLLLSLTTLNWRMILLNKGTTCNFWHQRMKGDYMSIKHGIKIQRHNFSTEWMTPELPPGGSLYYPGKALGAHYQPTPGAPPVLASPWTPPATLGKPPPTPYHWRPAGFVDEQHPKIQEMMEPLLTKFRGRCLVSNILTASGTDLTASPDSTHIPMESAGYT